MKTVENIDGVPVTLTKFTWDRQTNKFVPARKAAPYQKKLKFQFYQFPKRPIDQIILASHDANLAVLAQLYELWFTDFQKNPVKLTSYSLRKYRISRYQKLRALELLERSGQITVERRNRKNPLVTLNWVPLRK